MGIFLSRDRQFGRLSPMGLGLSQGTPFLIPAAKKPHRLGQLDCYEALALSVLYLHRLASCPQLLRLRLTLMADTDLNTRDSSSNKDLEKNHDGLTAVVPASTAVINASGHVSASQLDRSFLMQRLLRNVILTADVGFSYRWTSYRGSTKF